MTVTIKPRPAIERMPSEFGIREGRASFLRLDYNENTVGCSFAVRKALARLTAAQIATYPEYGAAREKLARHFRVSANEVVLSNGADESLRLIFDAFLDRGKTILVVDPTFTMYRVYAGLYESQVISLRYDFKHGFPLEEACAVLREKRPRVFFLANPNNPTGTLISTESIGLLLEAGRETLVVVDEAYFDFCGVTVLPWIRRHQNLVVVRTFSKANGLAGLRLGCTFANASTALALRKAQPPFPVNTAALAAAEAAMRGKAHVRKFVREVLGARRELEKYLQDRGAPCWKSHTNFLLVDFGAAAPGLLRALERKGILLRDRTPDFQRPGWVRVTVGTRAQTRQLLRALREVW